MAARRWQGTSRCTFSWRARWLRAIVFRWLLEKIGFAQARLVITSGAPLPPAVAALWHAWGLNLCEAYGQTETGGALVSGQRGPFPRPGNVGTPAPNLDVRLDDENEVLVKGPDLLEGYWHDDAATATLYREGRLVRATSANGSAMVQAGRERSSSWTGRRTSSSRPAART